MIIPVLALHGCYIVCNHVAPPPVCYPINYSRRVAVVVIGGVACVGKISRTFRDTFFPKLSSWSKPVQRVCCQPCAQLESRSAAEANFSWQPAATATATTTPVRLRMCEPHRGYVIVKVSQLMIGIDRGKVPMRGKLMAWQKKFNHITLLLNYLFWVHSRADFKAHGVQSSLKVF